MRHRLMSARSIVILTIGAIGISSTLLTTGCGGAEPSQAATVAPTAVRSGAVCPDPGQVQSLQLDQHGQPPAGQDVAFPDGWKSPNQYAGLKEVRSLRAMLDIQEPQAQLYSKLPGFRPNQWVTLGIAGPDGSLTICAQPGIAANIAYCPGPSCATLEWINTDPSGNATPWPRYATYGIPSGVYFRHPASDALAGGAELVIVGFTGPPINGQLGYVAAAFTEGGQVL